jgi:hypothetical protein
MRDHYDRSAGNLTTIASALRVADKIKERL